ncbi:MAG: anhydro-N-acetylmuramic acid kinase [Stenotrophobium sp.]
MSAACHHVGLMSGTSMDGVDAALCAFHGNRFERILATHTLAYPAPLRAQLLHLQRDTPAITLREFADLDRQVAEVFASAAIGLLESHAHIPITALGSHGQTVFHDPSGVGSSLQLGDPNLIAARTGITTVADFRRRDIALGGQGAPLVPAFHHACFSSADEARCVVNIGGIANVTVLPTGDAPVLGFDTGPGNGLMDEWTERHLQQAFDLGGVFAASGKLNKSLLTALMAEPYFAQSPPKSTGRGDFHINQVERRYPALAQLPPADVQRTFCELTALSIADAIRVHAPATQRVIVCGGGAKNGWLMQRLTALCALPIAASDDFGLASGWVEAAAFAWLAMRTLKGLPGNLPTVTGARSASILGGIFRA